MTEMIRQKHNVYDEASNYLHVHVGRVIILTLPARVQEFMLDTGSKRGG